MTAPRKPEEADFFKRLAAANGWKSPIALGLPMSAEDPSPDVRPKEEGFGAGDDPEAGRY
jgi:hypothetical protein